MKFEPNMGSTDRMIRLAAGALLVILALAGTIGAWGYIGVILVATAALRFCPGYLPFGLSTCGKKAG